MWNVAQFLISGIGVFVVSIYDYSNLAYFVLAMTMVNAIVGLLGAIVNPIIQPIVKLNEAGNGFGVDRLVIALSMILSLVIFSGVNFSNYISIYVLELWAGKANGILVNNYFNMLLVAFSIRMVIAPYGMKLVANAKQLKIAHYPVIEGILNLILSIFFVKKYGAIGIAYGTTVSALVIICVYTVRFTLENVQRSFFTSILLSFLLIPILSVVSVFLFDYFSDNGYFTIAIAISFFVSFFYIKRFIISVKGIVNETKEVC
ncbi:polysaccharide biosynthesis protein [Shewanella baltica]|nr:polysaccharide biosynthesis protein [Shewanella baltica]UVW66173.1 polysaccharide biosynthesis protein [Shewanella baltica]